MASYYRRIIDNFWRGTSGAVSTSGMLKAWLDSFPKNADGFINISDERRFAHDETEYDTQYNNDPSNFASGAGLIKTLKEMDADFSCPAIEVGCGTGVLTLGLVKEQAFPLLLATDPTSIFLKLTRKKCVDAGVDSSRLVLGVLDGSDVAMLPPQSLSLITLRSVLHHILDVDSFIAAASRALVPNGVLAFEEPCAEAFILMGGIAQFLPVLARIIHEALEAAVLQRDRRAVFRGVGDAVVGV
jgi:SAM-dependent methyltransferase